ncbi:MAG TPA: hypothetical protein VLK29_12735 [Luteimonas sp.]|nr:hypothetical protein [Luteimonas sp.]
MYKYDTLTDKALEIVSQVGDSLKNSIPDTAGKWLQTGAALGMAKTGTKVAGAMIRRNPAMAVAAAAGAGLLWFAARRQQKKSERGAIEGRATRVEARRAGTAPRKRAASKRASRTTTSQD